MVFWSVILVCSSFRCVGGGAAFVEDPGQDGPCVCFDVQVPVFIPISEKKNNNQDGQNT